MEHLQQIIYTLINIPVIFILLTVHSLTKVIVSVALGDYYPKNNGRLSLNPIKHTDAIGFLMLFFTGFGWDKPVKTSSLYYKNKKLGSVIVNLAPILACFVLSAVSLFVYKHFAITFMPSNPWFEIVRKLLINLSIISLSFGIFNIIPVYPLDGAGVLRAYLTPNQAIAYSGTEGLLQMLLVFAVMLGLLNIIITPAVNLIYYALLVVL